jgi:TonB-dependent receptor
MRRPANRILTGLALAGVASTSLAQAPGDDTPIEEVVVTASPIRDSQAAALEAKRLADNYVDIVSADTIGRFPDQNLADSIGRLPGVAIERDQGQARYLNLRGAPFRWTSIAFDGIDVPGAENGRIPRFDSFPATITSRVEVNKAILPSMPGESVAGFVNVHTFNPFDVEGPSLAVDVGFGEQDLGGGDVDRFSLRGSWSGDNIGFVGFASQNSREQVTDNREYDLGLTDGGEVIVNSLDFRSYKVTREDAAYGGRVEYRGKVASKACSPPPCTVSSSTRKRETSGSLTPSTRNPERYGRMYRYRSPARWNTAATITRPPAVPWASTSAWASGALKRA